MIDFLVNEMAKIVNPEPSGPTTIVDVNNVPVESLASDWISRVRYDHGLGPYAELNAEIGAIPMDGPPAHLIHKKRTQS